MRGDFLSTRDVLYIGTTDHEFMIAMSHSAFWDFFGFVFASLGRFFSFSAFSMDFMIL